ncbi:4Fe-4S binding protein [Mesohalobacter halotolerans]|uniref:4Fe-4S binding protein n=1 Tax=Mesohalobacter halotolerans TaxID=1883405 RepID=A0A4V6AP22_9FLAO|nr:4Fe-4S dicluster domain-containing protein [Mesohalobacter halotolerans]MBS3737464.1 4Fe-4S binding protein [Psychroflexus sp.]TKS57045.1 4Fe-4S binding protein [Mesohalobacter halotolerans]
MSLDQNMSVTGRSAESLNGGQKTAAVVGMAGLLILAISIFNVQLQPQVMWLTGSLILIAGGIIWYAKASYSGETAGIKNDGVFFKSISSRGLWAYLTGIGLTGFYILLYFYPEFLGLVKNGDNTGIIALFDPLSKALSGNPASQWFVYGTLYTLVILAFGIKFIWKYRHSRYQQIRTISVMFFQTSFAFLIPEFMARLNGDKLNLPYYDLKNIWPLNYYNFEQYRVDAMISSGDIGLAFLIFGVASIFIITPILTYFYGKRWYCSWVCGCGGLAETSGDCFRQLSDKSLFAWRVERWAIHSVLVFVVVMTTSVVYSYLKTDLYWLQGDTFLWSVAILLTLIFGWVMIFKRHQFKKDVKIGAIGYILLIFVVLGLHAYPNMGLFLLDTEDLRSTYGFLIGSIFSGVIGTGFYPIFGNRVWCRFGCPMAAILGFQQRLFSKFRITTNGGQCISCGNCSTYCEMGIDVRAYAQKGENIVRSSCVGCGICSAVCPRGVLNLENDSLKDRINPKDVLLGNDVDLMAYVNAKK